MLVKPLLGALAIFLTAAAGATSGGLDKCGCHNSKTAGFHCHKDLCPAPKSAERAASGPAATPPANAQTPGKKP